MNHAILKTLSLAVVLAAALSIGSVTNTADKNPIGSAQDVPQKLPIPRLINLYDNPQERIEETIGKSAVVTRGWVAHAMLAEIAKFQASLKKDPPVPMGTSDPYTPPIAR